MQWLKYSKKEFCELCKHKFTFKPSKFKVQLFDHRLQFHVMSMVYLYKKTDCYVTRLNNDRVFDTFCLVYAADMPKRLPIRDIAGGLFNSVLKAVRYWLHYTLVAIAWLGVVPLTACKYTKMVSCLLFVL